MAVNNRLFLRYYDEYKDKIYTFFLYRVNFNREQAEDLTADVFLKAFRKFDTFERARSFQAWIYTIARNHLCNYYRSQKWEVEITKAQNIGVEFKSQWEASLELERVIKYIWRLEPYYKEVLLLRFVDGLTNSEIAQMLDKEQGAVRTQVSRALQVLREQLEEFR